MSHNSSLAVKKSPTEDIPSIEIPDEGDGDLVEKKTYSIVNVFGCLLYTSPSPRD